MKHINSKIIIDNIQQTGSKQKVSVKFLTADIIKRHLEIMQIRNKNVVTDTSCFKTGINGSVGVVKAACFETDAWIRKTSTI